jgi:hypothetical protein
MEFLWRSPYESRRNSLTHGYAPEEAAYCDPSDGNFSLLLRNWQFRKARCHEFDRSPLLIETDGDAFSNRQILKQVRILNREHHRLF